MNVCIAIAALLMVAGVQEGGAKFKIERTPIVSNSDVFEGGEYRANLHRANVAIARRDFSTAHSELNTIRAYCDAKVSDTHTTYVSVETVAQSQEFAEAHTLAPPIQIVDIACPASYKMAAFLSIDEGDSAEAKKLLKRAQTLAPFWAEAVAEEAYLVRSEGDFATALALYRKAIALVKEHAGSIAVEAAALRGVGFILVEQGDLAAARTTYEEALGLDPDSQITKSELDYIGKLERGKTSPK